MIEFLEELRAFRETYPYGVLIRKDEPSVSEMPTGSEPRTDEKDECAKEYEELGLKELKELINADRKTEPQMERSTDGN